MKIIAQQFLGGLSPLHPANRGAAATRAPLLPTAMLDGDIYINSLTTVANLIDYSLKDLLEDKQLMLNFSKVI